MGSFDIAPFHLKHVLAEIYGLTQCKPTKCYMEGTSSFLSKHLTALEHVLISLDIGHW